MADVIFEEEQEGTPRAPVSTQPSAIIRFIYKLGLAKTPQGANYVMVGVIIVCIILALLSLFWGGIFETSPTPTATVLGPQATPPTGAVQVP